MRYVDSPTLAALAKRELKRRNFIWLTGYDFSTRAPYTIGFWDDVGKITASYIDVDSGMSASRDYTGGGTLLAIDRIPLVSDLSIRTINASISQLNQDTINLIRGYDLHRAPVEIHRGIFKPSTHTLVAPLLPRFVGFVDKNVILDPVAGNDGKVTLSLVSHTRMLTRINTDVRSDASQQARASGDTFYKDVATVGSWQIFWAEQRSTIAAMTVPQPSEENI